jgi:two-component system CheB/CheR fusion protein
MADETTEIDGSQESQLDDVSRKRDEGAPPVSNGDGERKGEGAGRETARADAPELTDGAEIGDSLGSGDGTALLSLSVEASGPELQPPALAYPVVAIGASAGGLQAVRELLENLDPETGMAFVLVTHLSPDHKSFLKEIVDRYTRMPVAAAEHGGRPEPNQVYILQPNQLLQLRGGYFHVEERGTDGRGPLVIDTFMRSLAADQKNHAIGVVLSGADGDGASGLHAIKGEGGIALVQSPETAAQPGMPRSSIASDHVDVVAPPGELATELGRLAYHFMRPEVRALEEGAIGTDDEQSFMKILQLLRSISGLELRQYKPETLRRRMARRMILMRKENLSEYLRLLKVRPDELRLLQEDLLINVTRFFRDPGFWESVRENVLPVLLKDRGPDRPLRVWCAGCSTGEEAYSMAITIIEYMSQNGLDVPFQIFGTDASERSVETARTAVYPESLATEIAPERLRRFFVKTERGYQMSKRVRDACIFARQNLCSDPPFSHIDILSCRNVMIYFNQVLQRQVMVTFHYALSAGGFMLLGMSEGLRDYNDIFSTVDRKHKIYVKTGMAMPYRHDAPRSYGTWQGPGMTRTPAAPAEATSWPEVELQRDADRLVLARFGLPGLIVDERLNVLQTRGQTGPFVELSPGSVSWNLLRVLKDGIAGETRAAVQRAMRENIPTTASAVLMDEEKGEQHIQIEVLPITSAMSRARCFLILFQTLSAQPAVDQPPLPQLTTDQNERLITQLRQDLGSTHFHLQSMVEERDARNQELVSANEEIQSANEELQSTNEELETTKEELQSANEELQTVNEELQQRNNVLTQTGNDLTNLLNSVNIPLLMLTSDLHIRQFTPPMQRLLSVRPADIGRSINEIRLQLSIENIEPILHDVLETLATRELEVQDRDGRWNLLRVRPYRTAENKIEGLVVVLLDIDQLRSSQQRLLEANHFSSTVVEGVPVPIVVASEDCTVRTANTAFRGLAGMGAKELEGRSLPELLQHLWGLEHVRERLSELPQEPGTKLEFEHESTTNDRRTLLVNAQVLSADGNKVYLLMMEDITLRREAVRLISQQKNDLESAVKQAAGELERTQEELRGLTASLFSVQEEERQKIARELHDDVAQRLSALEMLLSDAQKSAGQEGADKIEQGRQQVQALNNDIRQISHLLHPAILEDLGLNAALKSLVDEFGKRENMPASYVGRNLPAISSQPAAIAIYRITQEALRNVAKHAGKTHVKIILEGEKDRLHLEIKDLGQGFDHEGERDLPRRGLGLISMKERARLAHGSLSVTSALGEGTTVTADIPFERDA